MQGIRLCSGGCGGWGVVRVDVCAEGCVGLALSLFFIYQRRCFSKARLCACVCSVCERLIFFAHTHTPPTPPYLKKELKAGELLFLIGALIIIRFQSCAASRFTHTLEASDRGCIHMAEPSQMHCVVWLSLRFRHTEAYLTNT